MIHLNIQILCSRPGFLVCVKPAGVLSESPGLPDLLCTQEKLPRLYPVHRLDLGTGGLMVLAKTSAACAKLTGCFAEGLVQKSYYAIVETGELPIRGTYSDYLFHDRYKNKTFIVKTLRKGVKKASCDWQKIATAEENGSCLHLIRVELHTGRTHQIRVQFASRGMPLLGDQRYGSKHKDSSMALWASGLSFPDPSNEQDILSFQINPPEEDPWDKFSRFFRMRDTATDVLPGQADGFPLLR